MPLRDFSAAVAVFAILSSTALADSPVEHASADDCAIFVTVGKAQLGWGDKPPAYDFFPTWDRKADGTYLEDCRWTELGVAAPVTGSPASRQASYITRPVYSGDTARVDYAVSIRPPEGQHIGPFLEDGSCTLAKTGGAWKIVECHTTAIT